MILAITLELVLMVAQVLHLMIDADAGVGFADGGGVGVDDGAGVLTIGDGFGDGNIFGDGIAIDGMVA